MNGIILELSLIVVLGAVLSYLFSKFKQPMIIGYILTGFIIGPSVFGLVKDYVTIQGLSELGIAFLLYAIGAELSIDKIKSIKKSIFLVTIIEVFGIFGIGLLLSKYLLGLSWMISVFIGVIVSLSSTAVVMKYLSDQKLVNTLKSRIILGILLIQDLIILLFLPLLIDFNAGFTYASIPLVIGKIILLVVVALAINFVFADVLKESFKRKDLLFLISLASCFAFIGLSALMNFSIIIGAFIGGLILTNYPYKLEIIEQIDETKSFFSMLFFVSLGLQITAINSINWWLMLLLFALAVILKPLILFIGSLLSGYDEKISFYVSSSLFQISEFSLVLVQFATLQGLFNESLTTTLILFISLSLIFTPYVLSKNNFLEKLFYPINKYIVKITYKRKKDELDNTEEKDFTNHIVLFGLGRMGMGVLDGLLKSKFVEPKDIVVVDDDPDSISKVMEKNIFCICGQADNPEILDKLALNHARAIVITIPYYDVNETILKHINLKKVPVFVRAYFVQEAIDYYKKGIRHVVIPQVMATNELIRGIFDELNNVKQGSLFNELLVDTMKRYSKEETFLKRHHRYSAE